MWVDFGASLDNPKAYNELKNGITGIPNVVPSGPGIDPPTEQDVAMLPELVFRVAVRTRERPEMLQSLEPTVFWDAVRKIRPWAASIADLRSLAADLGKEPAPGPLWTAWVLNTRGAELEALLQHPSPLPGSRGTAA